MPRHSGEERSAAYYRAGVKPASPPAGMSAEARAIWREIVWSKPVDWFDPGSLGILKIHCEARAISDGLMQRLGRIDEGSEEFTRLSKDWIRYVARASATARELRLTVQWAIERQEQKRLREKPMQPLSVIGGKAAA